MHWGNLGVLDEKEVESLGSTILVLPDLAASIGLKSLDEASAAAPVPAYDRMVSRRKRIAYSVFQEVTIPSFTLRISRTAMPKASVR